MERAVCETQPGLGHGMPQHLQQKGLKLKSAQHIENSEARGHPQPDTRLLQQQQGHGRVSYGTWNRASPAEQQPGQHDAMHARGDMHSMQKQRQLSLYHSIVSWTSPLLHEQVFCMHVWQQSEAWLIPVRHFDIILSGPTAGVAALGHVCLKAILRHPDVRAALDLWGEIERDGEREMLGGEGSWGDDWGGPWGENPPEGL